MSYSEENPYAPDDHVPEPWEEYDPSGKAEQEAGEPPVAEAIQIRNAEHAELIRVGAALYGLKHALAALQGEVDALWQSLGGTEGP